MGRNRHIIRRMDLGPLAAGDDRSLCDRVVRTLGSAIVREEVAPGAWFSTEAALGARFGVSRSVIREALKRLEGKGLIEARPKRGVMVLSRDRWHLLDPEVASWRYKGVREPRLLLELVGFREVIEPALAAAAALQAKAEDAAELRALAVAMREAGSNSAELIRADHALHRAVARIAGNSLLYSAFAALEPGMAELRSVGSESRLRGPGHNEDHLLLVEAIVDGRPEVARETMARIVHASRLQVMEFFDRSPSAPARTSLREGTD